MNPSQPTVYPLQWPNGWPITPAISRVRNPSFKCDVPQALRQLEKEIRLLGGQNLVLSSNYTLGDQRPKEPGVVAYFQYEKTPVAIPCDRWAVIEHNIRAIALTIEAMRGMERWGAKHMIKAMFTGFKQLPASANGRRPWWQVFGLIAQPVKNDATCDTIRAEFNRLAKLHHPDVGGSHSEMIEVNEAWAEYEKWRQS